MSRRNPAVLGQWGPTGTRVVASESMWRQPVKWDRDARQAGDRRRVFCASLADVFEDWRGPMVNSRGRFLHTYGGTWPWALASTVQSVQGDFRPLTMDDLRRRLACLIWETQNLDWLLLTKRIENAQQMIYEMWFPDAAWPKNYWLGTTVENRKQGLPRIDILRATSAPVKFLSGEPLLEDIGKIDLTGIDLVIIGGESSQGGQKARPFDIAWARSLIAQCRAAGIKPFMKQLGSRPYDSANRISLDGPDSHAVELSLDDHHGGDWDEWPRDIRIREMPDTATPAAR
jgi:protein gp37